MEEAGAFVFVQKEEYPGTHHASILIVRAARLYVSWPATVIIILFAAALVSQL